MATREQKIAYLNALLEGKTTTDKTPDNFIDDSRVHFFHVNESNGLYYLNGEWVNPKAIAEHFGVEYKVNGNAEGSCNFQIRPKDWGLENPCKFSI